MGHFLAGIATARGLNVKSMPKSEYEPRERRLVSVVFGHVTVVMYASANQDVISYWF